MASNKKPVNLLDSIFEAAYLYRSRLDETFKKQPVSYQQYLVLKIILQTHPKPIMVKEIRSAMPDKNSDVTRIIEKLVQKDFVSKNSSLIDKRSAAINLNDAAIALCIKLDKKVKKLEKSFKVLSKKERKIFANLLKKLQS